MVLKKLIFLESFFQLLVEVCFISKKDKTWYFIILGGPGSEEARGGELKRTFNLSERIFVFFCKANKICVKILKNTKSLKDA